MEVRIERIPQREVLHFLGWRGTPIEEDLLRQIKELSAAAIDSISPRVCLRRFALGKDMELEGAAFCPQGRDVRAMLDTCHEAVLFAATLGADSERLLLRAQAKDGAQALIMDAVLSAAIEGVCDKTEDALRRKLKAEGLYLTDRFSPGYGDMPLGQSREILSVLRSDREIGLTVSQSGIMIPRKSVSAIMGVSRSPVPRRMTGCEACAARETCALRRRQDGEIHRDTDTDARNEK